MSDREGSAPTPILASDAEREHAITRLRDAAGEGRLTLEEFSERVEAAQHARTDTELARLGADLPAAATGAATAALAAPEHRALFSHIVREGPWRLPARSAWRSVFGTIDLDLRQARLEGTDTVLDVHNLFGTVTVVVPEGIEVAVSGGGIWASQKIEAPERPPLPGAPRISIRCSGPGGTLHVRPRPLVRSVVRRLLSGGA